MVMRLNGEFLRAVAQLFKKKEWQDFSFAEAEVDPFGSLSNV